MVIFDTFKSGIETAVNTISTVTQNLIDKKRTDAKLCRLRDVMKSESELMNRAYIALGKGYYEQIKKGEKPSTEREQKLVELIDNCKARIARARECYRKIVENRNADLFAAPVEKKAEESFEKQDVVDITVACSNESEYASSPFPKAEKKDVVEKIADEFIDDESPIEELFE